MPGILIVIAVVAVIALLYFCYKSSMKKQEEKFDNFLDVAQELANSCNQHEITKEQVIQKMKPETPLLATSSEVEDVIRFYSLCRYDEYLYFSCFCVTGGRDGKTIYTNTSKANIVFYFSKGKLIAVRNLSREIENAIERSKNK